MRVRGGELGLGQPAARLLEEIALADLLRPHLVPARPATREVFEGDAADGELFEMLDALLALALELLLHAALHLRLLATACHHIRTRLLKLLA